MTGMWPTGVSEQHHGSHQQHMQQVAYNSGYPVSSLDIYGSSAGFDGWSVAQAAAQQYGVGGGPVVGAHQHMLPHMGGHMGPHMMTQMGGHMPHTGSNSSTNRQNNMMMHSWAPQHMHMPLMMHPHGSNSSSPPGSYAPQGTTGSRGGNWPLNPKAGGSGGGGFSNGRQPGGGRGMAGGRGHRQRKPMVLNTNPGKCRTWCGVVPAEQQLAMAVHLPHSSSYLDLGVTHLWLWFSWERML